MNYMFSQKRNFLQSSTETSYGPVFKIINHQSCSTKRLGLQFPIVSEQLVVLHPWILMGIVLLLACYTTESNHKPGTQPGTMKTEPARDTRVEVLPYCC